MGTVEIGWLGTGWEREKPSRERELEQRSVKARGWLGVAGGVAGDGERKCREQRVRAESESRERESESREASVLVELACFGFGKCTTLLELDLSYNELKGEIPHGISNFQNLESLSLGYNHLTGKIPESFGQLKHLTTLDLQHNSFSGSIPSSLGNLSYMSSLILCDNKLNGTLPKSLGVLSNLEQLDVKDNFLGGSVDEVFFTKLFKLKYLVMSRTSLFFDVNSHWVPPFQLKYVDMSSCKIGPNFPVWLQTQRSLQVLLMSKSGILGTAPGWFWNWTSKVYSINLSSNHIEGDVSDIVVNSTVLNLRDNHLKGQLPHLSTNVRVLNIANNLFSGPISTFLCHKMNRKNKLKVLDASNNLLSGELSHCWRYWQSLIHLNFGSNRLSGRIPYSMGSLFALKALRLHNNNIFGDIPSSLKKCSNLGLIDIGENHLSVAIPFWIGEMTSLTILRLRSNGLRGRIPLQICQLSSLKVLDLANNSLSGSISKCLNFISAMAMPHTENYETIEYFVDEGHYFESLMLVPKGEELEYEENLIFVSIIDLSSNNLTGSIPTEISVLSELCFLNLSRNHLTGKIPEKIGTMKELESVDLSRNHLSGEIPPSMSNLTFLSYLDLSYNNFSGRIPLSTQLQSFDALSYAGNPELRGAPLELCGAPLKTNCTKEQESDGATPVGKAEDDSETSWFYIGLGAGFAVGFWGVCGCSFLQEDLEAYLFPVC
uniref:Disease resistance R13L4/SHOC-2-like LRR domain-containing protein n=1 Tax=Fagus sylvatica TaxID=28930 RepID=A0A2N9GT82_FAGSY